MQFKKIKKRITRLIPPVLLDSYRNANRKYGYFGVYNNWEEAKKNSTGYDSDLIIEKVKDSALKVKNGEVAYERDSMVFKEIEPSWHVLAPLLWIASKNNNSLNVLDFGGALGTSYYQNRGFLNHLNNFKWSIIEQTKFVDYGKKLFEDQNLKFYFSTEEYGKDQEPDVVIMSSVIQYLENPYEQMEDVLKLNPKFIIFDKTPFTKSGNDIITVQKVPSHIYNASYPSWVFDFNKFISFFNKHDYNLRTNLSHYSKDIFSINNVPVSWEGFLLEHINK